MELRRWYAFLHSISDIMLTIVANLYYFLHDSRILRCLILQVSAAWDVASIRPICSSIRSCGNQGQLWRSPYLYGLNSMQTWLAKETQANRDLGVFFETQLVIFFLLLQFIQATGPLYLRKPLAFMWGSKMQLEWATLLFGQNLIPSFTLMC